MAPLPFLVSLLLVGFAGINSANAETSVPKGFENPNLLRSLLAGSIAGQDVRETNSELEYYTRIFFAKVSPDAIVDLMTDQAKFPSMFPDVRSGSHTKVSENVFNWMMTSAVKVGIFNELVDAQGTQTVFPANDNVGEWKMTNTITNQGDELRFNAETTRFIPYQGGTLVEDNLHVILIRTGLIAKIAKKQLREKSQAGLRIFRNQLRANP